MSNHATPDALLWHIQESINLGLWESADAVCRELIALAPNDSRAWFHLGQAALKRGQPQAAEDALQRAINLAADNPTYWDWLSLALEEQGKVDAAEQCARRAIALNAAQPNYWLSLGNALFGKKQWAEAADAFRHALALDPQHAGAWCNLAAAEQSRGQLTAALEAYERSLVIDPNQVHALANCARLHCERNQPRQTLELTARLTSIAPQRPSGWVIRGNALLLLEDYDQAQEAYQQALLRDPLHAEATCNLASSLYHQGRLTVAEAVARRLLSAKSDNAEAWTLLGVLQQSSGRPEEALDSLRRTLLLESNAQRHSRYVWGLQYTDGVTPQQLLAAHCGWETVHAGSVPVIPTGSMPARSAGERLRIGFVSADFHRHPTSFLVLPALEYLDRTACLVTCYSDSASEDAFTQRFRAAADVWRVVCGQSDQELYEQVHEDRIDILVDLMGHTGKRLPVFVRKPAAVQVAWFGYVGTTGLSTMDYLLADRFHVGRGEEANYVETVLRMPQGYACYGPPDYSPEVGPLPALTSGYATFGCFNGPVKYARSNFDRWAAVLRRVPQSRLLLKYGGLDQPEVQQFLRGEFAERAIEADRILLEGNSPHEELLAAYNHIDIALDTQPYSGGVTTCEALWMGVPVITFPGKTFAGRHSVSHLTNAGHEQFIAADAAGYVDLAVEWANRLDELAVIRSQMREQVLRSPLCDAPRFALDLLTILRAAWDSRAATPAERH